MKITVEHRDVPENEIVLRCRELDDEMLHVLSLLRSGMQTICGWTEDKQMVFLRPGEVLYAESVDNRTWLYCEDTVRRTALTLAELEERWAATGLLRCGKSCVVNLYAIRRLRSCGGGRIEATLSTGEKIMISRHYAPALREKLGM